MANKPDKTQGETDLAEKLKSAAAEIAELKANLEIKDGEIASLKRLLRQAQDEGAAKSPAPAAGKAAGVPGPAVQIAARPKNGFRRLGLHHPAEPVKHPAGTFTVAQIAVLKADPNLSVVEV